MKRTACAGVPVALAAATIPTPILLQDHSTVARYRNLTIRPVPAR